MLSGVTVATANHPFWVESRKAWLPASGLLRGDALLTDVGERTAVLAAESFLATRRVHNLTIADLHTYYVAVPGQSVLVHHVGECPVNGVPHGKLGEAATKHRLESEGYTNITPEVRFRALNGVEFRADFVAQGTDGRWIAVETKTGRGATLSPGQSVGYDDLHSFRATVDTSRLAKFGMHKGKPVTMRVEFDFWECPVCGR